MGQDLFEFDSLDSVVRKLFSEKGIVHLNDFEIRPYHIPADFEVKEFKFSPNDYASEIRAAIEPIAHIAEAKGFANNLFTAIYEAVLNAYQHGNKRSPDKSVVVAYKIDSDVANIAVIDQGGEIEPDFIPFVLRHRQTDVSKKFIDYYAFTGKQKPESNNGTGTSFMHTYINEVKYFKSSQGGLVVHMTKKHQSSK